MLAVSALFIFGHIWLVDSVAEGETGKWEGLPLPGESKQILGWQCMFPKHSFHLLQMQTFCGKVVYRDSEMLSLCTLTKIFTTPRNAKNNIHIFQWVIVCLTLFLKMKCIVFPVYSGFLVPPSSRHGSLFYICQTMQKAYCLSCYSISNKDLFSECVVLKLGLNGFPYSGFTFLTIHDHLQILFDAV